MTKTAQRQQAKGEAFNAINRMFHPLSHWKAPEFPRDESYREKRDDEVERIMTRYFKKLEKINKNK